MKSRYEYILGILLTSILSACSSSTVIDNPDETVEEEQVPVLFGSESSYESVTTRANNDMFIDGTKVLNIPEKGHVGVFGFYQETADWSGTNTANFFYNQDMTAGKNVTTTNTAGKVLYNRAPLTYSPQRYWPNGEDDKCSFFGYYPFVASGTTNYGLSFTNNTNGGMGTFSYTVDPDQAKQVDFLVSDLEANMAKQKISERVNLKFHHMTSQVIVNVRVGANVKNYTINSLGFNKLKQTGTLTPKCTYDETTMRWNTTFAWSGQTSEQNYDCPTAENETLDKATYFLLLPQSFEGTDATLEWDLSYMPETSDKEQTKVGKMHLDGEEHFVTGDSGEKEPVNNFKVWTAGVTYVYTLTIGSAGVSVTMSLDKNWQTGKYHYQEIDDNTVWE